MYILKLAFRNIFRNKRRSMLAITSVTIAISFVIFLSGMLAGMMESIVSNYTKNECGHIRVSTIEFEKDEKFSPIDNPIVGYNAIVEKIKNDSVIKSETKLFAPRISFGVVLSNQGKTKTALAMAGDVVVEKSLLMLQKTIIEGRYLDEGNQREIIIGSGLAKSLGYKIGAKIKIMTTGKDYSMRMRSFKLVGIYQTNSPMLDDKVFQISLVDAQKLLRYKEDESQQLLLMLNDYKKSDQMADYINQNIIDNASNVKATSWTKIGEYYTMLSTQQATYSFIYFIIASLGAIIIGNIMTMVVLERSHEIGILKGLGMSKTKIRNMFFVEGFLLGLAGVISGLIPGLLLITYFNKHGMDFSEMMQNANIPMDSVIVFQFDVKMIVTICIMGLVVSAFLSLFPALRASRLDAVKALKSL